MNVDTADSCFDFPIYAQDKRLIVEERLQSYLSDREPKLLWESMRYSVLSGGKRVRALLCLAGAEAIKDDDTVLTDALPCACAIEMIHSMSLIHDDLPAMDNDDYRRGKLTNHKVFGEAMALLAGDALLAYAMEVLLERTSPAVDRQRLIRVSIELAKSIGASGMVGGQAEDLLFTGAKDAQVVRGEVEARTSHASTDYAGRSPGATTLDHTQLAVDDKVVESIHRKKTGALIRFSLWSGACLAGADESQLNGLIKLGELLGLAFQIADDLLDVTGDIKTLGKTPGKDAASQKATWVRVFGVDGARVRLKELESEGENLLRSIPLQQSGCNALMALLRYAIHRVN